jgi:hypothetical protein
MNSEPEISVSVIWGLVSAGRVRKAGSAIVRWDSLGAYKKSVNLFPRAVPVCRVFRVSANDKARKGTSRGKITTKSHGCSNGASATSTPSTSLLAWVELNRNPYDRYGSQQVSNPRRLQHPNQNWPAKAMYVKPINEMATKT